jgi:hypothetical protein
MKMEEGDPLKKKNSLIIKMCSKFQEQIEEGTKLILQGRTERAIPLLEDMIKTNRFLDVFPFESVNHPERWLLSCSKGPIQMFEQLISKNKFESNPFDLLDICFQNQIFNKEAHFDEIVLRYKDLAEKIGARQEIHMGLANVYYLQEWYHEAGRLYRKVLLGEENANQEGKEREEELCKYAYTDQYANALLGIAWVRYRQGNRDRATSLCQCYLLRAPKDLCARLL